MTVQVDVQDAMSRLPQLRADVERGEDVVIARGGRPVVRLVPLDPPPSRPVGRAHGSLPHSFFDPLPDDELEKWS